MSVRSVLAAILLGIGLWYAIQTLAATAFLSLSTDDLGARSLWPSVAVMGVVSVACVVVAVRLGRRSADAVETSPMSTSTAWELARYGMGLYALYRAVLALGAIVGAVLGERRRETTYDLGGPIMVAPIVQLIVGTVFGVVLLVGPGRIGKAIRRLGKRRVEGTPA